MSPANSRPASCPLSPGVATNESTFLCQPPALPTSSPHLPPLSPPLPTHHRPPLTSPPSLQSNEWSEGRQLWLDNQFASARGSGHSALPQEPVGQRPRHSYSLSLDARPQIQMSSINQFLQGERQTGERHRYAWSAGCHLIQPRPHYYY